MVRKKKISRPVKIQGNSYSFEAAESEYDNQIPLSPTSVKGERTALKNYVHNKKSNIYWFLITIYSKKVKVKDPATGPVWPRGWVEV